MLSTFFELHTLDCLAISRVCIFIWWQKTIRVIFITGSAIIFCSHEEDEGEVYHVVRTPPSSKFMHCNDDSGEVHPQLHQLLRVHEPSHHTCPHQFYSSANELLVLLLSYMTLPLLLHFAMRMNC